MSLSDTTSSVKFSCEISYSKSHGEHKWYPTHRDSMSHHNTVVFSLRGRQGVTNGSAIPGGTSHTKRQNKTKQSNLTFVLVQATVNKN